MDFRLTSEKLDRGELCQDEIVTQILNLPCLYGIFQNHSQIFCLEVHNRQDHSEITVALLFSNLQIAMQAIKDFEIPNDWNIAQWSEIEEALKTCMELEVDGVAFDSLPKGYSLSGLIIDRVSLKELFWLCVSN